MADPRLKTIRINTGVLKRVCKETQSYQKEVFDIQDKIQKMQAEGEDVYLIKKQDGLLQEAGSVVADCQRRLNQAFGKLTALVEGEQDLSESEEYQNAVAVIDESRPHITA